MQSGQAGVEISANHILQNAPFRSQIFKIFFASAGKGALTPLTKILRTFLANVLHKSKISLAIALHPLSREAGIHVEV